MMTAASLVEDVAGNLKINNNSVDVGRFRVYDNLNAAQIHLLSVLPANVLDNAVKHTHADLVTGQDEYQWPSDYIRFLDCRIKYTTGGRYAQAKPAWTFQDNANYFRQPRAQYPIVDLSIERGFRMRPTPTADVDNGICLKYVYTLPTISSGQNSLLDEKWRNALVFFATALCASVEGAKPELFGQFMGLYQTEVAPYVPNPEAK